MSAPGGYAQIERLKVRLPGLTRRFPIEVLPFG
jgi:hypothetical protein